MFYRHVLLYSSVSAFGQLCRLLQEFLVRVVLSPQMLGPWSFILLMQNIGVGLDAGITTAMAREYPLLCGAKEHDKAELLRFNGVLLNVGLRILVALGMAIYFSIHYYYAGGNHLLLGLASAGLIILYSAGESLISSSQVTQNFKALSSGLLIYWPCYAILLFTGAYYFQTVGLVVGLALAYLLQAAVLGGGLFVRDFRNKSKLVDIASMKKLIFFALPLRCVDYPMNFFEMMDSLIITYMLGLHALAVYMTAKLIFNQVGQVPGWVNTVFIIRINTLIGGGRESKRQLSNDSYNNFLLLYLVIIPILVLFSYLIISNFVPIFLPKYSNAVPVVAFLLLAIMFHPRASFIRNFLIVENKLRVILYTNLVFGLCQAVGYFCLYYFHVLSLVSVAAVYSCSLFLYFIAVFFVTAPAIWGIKKSIGAFSYAMMSLGTCYTAIFGVVNFFVPSSHAELINTCTSIIAMLILASLGAYKIFNSCRVLV